MHSALRTALSVVVGVLVLGLVVATPAVARPTGTPLPFPGKPSGLPAPGRVGAAVDAPAPYQSQASCAAEPMPGTARLAELVLRTYGRGHDGGILRSCVVGDTSEHKDGRAWDWMLDLGNARDRRAAADFLAWVTGDDGVMARRLGIMYVIYNRKMWSTWSGGWERYDGYDPHTSHVHVSLGWNGARGRTSFWTGRTWDLDYGPCQVFRGSPATVAGRRPRTVPCPRPAGPARVANRPLLWLGATGADVRVAQRALGASATGSFDAATRTRTLRFQRRHDLPMTGAVDRATWAALLPSRSRSLHPEWSRAEARQWIRDAGMPVLRRGMTGRPVTALQATLGIPVTQRTGYFGARTRSLVQKVRRAHGLRGAKVTRQVWRLIG
jgi:peptidoglycan hydrolase-like protein with peptidoglycan-binding domain